MRVAKDQDGDQLERFLSSSGLWWADDDDDVASQKLSRMPLLPLRG
jgi:hypothetical protein